MLTCVIVISIIVRSVLYPSCGNILNRKEAERKDASVFVDNIFASLQVYFELTTPAAFSSYTTKR